MGTTTGLITTRRRSGARSFGALGSFGAQIQCKGIVPGQDKTVWCITVWWITMQCTAMHTLSVTLMQYRRTCSETQDSLNAVKLNVVHCSISFGGFHICTMVWQIWKWKMIQCNKMCHCCSVHCSAARESSALQCSTVQCNAVECNTTHCCAVLSVQCNAR